MKLSGVRRSFATTQDQAPRCYLLRATITQRPAADRGASPAIDWAGHLFDLAAGPGFNFRRPQQQPVCVSAADADADADDDDDYHHGRCCGGANESR